MLKHSKKLLTLMLAACLVVGTTLTGCGKNSSSTSSGGVVQLTYNAWGSADEDAVMRKLLDAFEAKYPKIKVKYNHIPDDYSNKMNTVLAGGAAPDVFLTSDGDFGRWVKAGLILDMQKYVDKSGIDLNDMWDSALVRYKYDGKVLGKGDQYSLPKDIGPTVLFYNKDIFKKEGIPFPSADKAMNLQEFQDLAIKLTKKDVSGKVTQYGTGPLWWEGYVWSSGADFLSADHKEFVLNSKEGIAAMQYAADLINKYHVSPDAKATAAMSADQMFNTGKIAMMGGGRWMVPTYRKLSFDWDVAPMPTGSLGTGYSWSGSVGYSIYKKCKHPEEAFTLIKFLAGPDGQKLGTQLGFQIPTFKSMSNTDLFLQKGQKPEHAEVFIKAAQDEKPGTWTLTPNSKWLDTFNQRINNLWEGKGTAEKVLNDMKPEIDKQLKEGNPEIFK
ncbi:sugar ABC transporter substrate-binding protein [Clostridium sp. 19966]|uniref:ABC transporter substrate-binding protein n=1 Tax=Clostridium sp. 19966 TaxID=2768166 RepID=UPI0028DE4F7A|nr:sugar ABC transporter substrate-binding protein [Clostridium sp. 19966]MDT8719141.1 sugar ABC transporter substrate-binding protein [Clostridium sp. 19966]